MKQVIQNYRTGELKLDDVPVPSLRKKGVLVRNKFSLISPGTERSMIELARKSLIGKARERPVLVRQVIDKAKRENLLSTFQSVMRKLNAPIPLGYSCAGEVLEIGAQVDKFSVGEHLACAGAGYASHAEVVSIPVNLCARIPRKVSDEQAAFTTLGAIALQGIRIARVSLGESVAVIGLGLLGLLTVQILKATGCHVLGIDLNPDQVSLAEDLGADMAVARQEDDLLRRVSTFSRGRGVDVVIITAATSSADPVSLAGEISRDRGRVVAVGNVKMEIPRKIYYEKELQFFLSRSYGPGRYDPGYEEKGIDYPIGYVRWTEQRNMEQFIELLSTGQVRVEPLITHRFRIDDAMQAYDLVTGGEQRGCLGVILSYNTDRPVERKIIIEEPRTEKTARTQLVRLGWIGAGNFATGVLLPVIKKIKGVKLQAIATTGASAKVAGQKYGFEYCVSAPEEIFADETISAVVIATQHDLHAPLAQRALQAGKYVFVEKPLALNREQLSKVAEAQKTSQKGVMVGFNRRFSSLVQHVRDFFQGHDEPLMMYYRVNAGFLEKNHWVQDAQQGGGRIVGEVCHFVDLMQFICGASPTLVYAQTISTSNESITRSDNVFINVKFTDGSLGSIGYSALGDRSFSKERIEIIGEGSVGIIEDFKGVQLVREGRSRKTKRMKQDKGYRGELTAFLRWVQGQSTCPIPLEESMIATLATFAMAESIAKGKSASVESPFQVVQTSEQSS